MIRVMIRNQQQLPQVRLICSSRDCRREIYVGVQSKPLQLVSVATEGSDTLIPRGGRGRHRGFGPVVIRPAAFLVLGIDAELEDVFLGYTKVLEQLPGRVGKASRHLPPQIGRDSPNNLVKAGVRVLPVE